MATDGNQLVIISKYIFRSESFSLHSLHYSFSELKTRLNRATLFILILFFKRVALSKDLFTDV